MREVNAASAANIDSTVGRSAYFFLILLFVGSGASALIYELVWYQLIGLVIGVSSISLGILLAVFMGGMCIGSLLLPRLVSSKHHPLKIYAFLEVGIAIFGILLLYAMPLLRNLYFGTATEGFLDYVLRGLFAGICLLPPTILMGATLPAIARWVKSTPTGVSWLGLFYGGNIAGAVLGTMLAGFYLLRVYDIEVATFVAVAFNLVVASTALVVSRQIVYEKDASKEHFYIIKEAWPIYVTAMLSGATALAAEVLWTRHLSLFIGATVYGFALILSVFLIGLGVGSTFGSRLALHLKSPKIALGLCQMLLCILMAWAAFLVTQNLPYWEVNVAGNQPWQRLQIDFWRCMIAMFPAAVLWGASFPLALASIASGEKASAEKDSASLVGGVYAANTFGAIIGALAGGFILVPWIGSQMTQQIIILVSGASALMVLISSADVIKTSSRKMLTGTAVLIISFASVFAVPPILEEVIAYGRYLPAFGQGVNVIYAGEGLTASIAVTQEGDGIFNYHNSGKIQASSYPQDMRLQRMLGHLTTLIPENQDNFLVIGLGAGITAGAVAIDPNAGKVTVAELEPLVPEVISTYFSEFNFDVVNNPVVDIHVDDGRHFLQTTDMTFDGITSDPLDPWVKGAAALYTKEFWQLAKSKLNPGGVVTVFVQLYESTEEAVKSEVGTFMKVFPNGAVFANTQTGAGYDLVLVGMADDDRIDVDRMIERFNHPRYAQVRASLAEVRLDNVTDLLSTFAGQPEDLAHWLEGADINIDKNMRLQYLAGMGLNLYENIEIYNNMLQQGISYPRDLFVGEEDVLEELEGKITRRQGRF
ncbi:fused MFS/spermidine synthase [Haliea sp. AH-315-K21]|nr:fused MFS/spermidine synthase [Haliea sp. AH-315-K21]